MTKNITDTQLIKLLVCFGFVLTIILLTGAGLAFVGRNFALNQVRNQLVQEKIYFPAKDSKALDPQEFPGLQRYAGQQVDSGPKAKAYANEFIWVHMMKASGGKTYAEVSAEVMANPQDKKLVELKNTLFQGDMLRSSLLTAYAFSVFGVIAGYGVVACLLAAIAIFLLSLFVYYKSKRF